MADPLTLIEKSKGKTLGQIIKQGFGGWLFGLSVALISGFQAAIDFLFLPFDIFVEVANTAVDSFLLEPMGITDTGFAETAAALKSLGQFQIVAGPISISLAMLGLLIVLGYLSLPITSNFLPGTLVDNPIWDIIFGTAEEDGGDEEG